MSRSFNAKLDKCIERIFSIVKYVWTKSNKRAIAYPKSKQSVLTSKRHILSNRTDAEKSIIGGFPLLGLIGLDESEENRQLIDIIKSGLLHLQNDDYNAFEQTLHEALKMANDLKNVKGIAHVYDVLGNGAFKNKEYEKAKDLFEKVIDRLIEQGAPKDDHNILYTGLKISKIYEDQKDYKKSEFGYIYILKNLENKIKIKSENEDDLRLYAITLDAYGLFLMDQGDIKGAIMSFRKAYKASVKINGEVFKMNVILLNDLGTIYYEQGNLGEALHYFTKAEQIGQHFPDMENLFRMKIDLEKVLFGQGMSKEAEQNCVEGMKNAKRHGRNDEDEDEDEDEDMEENKEAEKCLSALKKSLNDLK